jgi:CHASE2 domain-containing sensor protein
MALLQTVQFSLRGSISTLARSGVLGTATIFGWLLLLVAGPFASVQLWRLRRTGLYATAILAGFFLAYYFAGILFLRAHNAPFGPIVAAVVFNGVLIVLLASPAARRSCT